MQKYLIFIAAFLVVVPLSTLAENNDIEFFPLDQGLIWAYDDGNTDQIIAIDRITIPGMGTVNTFTFDPYNYEKRTFFGIGNKVYEWRNDQYRLWYDFDAKAGDSWKLEWISTGVEEKKYNHKYDFGAVSNEDPSNNDINVGAVVTLVETDAVVSTPMGDFKKVYQFTVTREGVSDAGYVKEWFAPDTGCIMRVWDTIAGPHQQRLTKFHRPVDKQNISYRMDVKLDKQIYMEGENIEIEVTVLNWSDKDITLDFPSSLQVDYFIDNSYTWSINRGFLTVITNVTIPARNVQKWTFTHQPTDYQLAPGKHFITAKLVGTDLKAGQEFLVTSECLTLPGDIELSVATSKATYKQGETIDFTVTATNTSQSDIALKVIENNPVVYSIDQEIPEISLLMVTTTGKVDVTVPAGGSVDFKGENSARVFIVSPGEHVLYAGLFGYNVLAKTEFTVTHEINYGAVAGTIVTPSDDNSLSDTENYKPVSGARVTLCPVIPNDRANELKFILKPEVSLWSTISNDEGSFLFDAVPIGSYYALNVEKDGYCPYNETIMFLSEKNTITIVLKPLLKVPDKPLTFDCDRVSDLEVSFGTDSSVYLPDAPFKAFLRITNIGDKDVTFTFDSENYVEWSLLEVKEQVIWSSSETIISQKNALEYALIFKPGESREFSTEGTFKNIVPNHGGKYIISGVLKFISSSTEGLKSGDISGAVKVLVIPAEPAVINRVQAQCNEREMYVDLKDKANTVVDIAMTANNVNGDLQVTELTQNLHKGKSLHRFIKMVEIDADEVIRENMEKAVVRIYYNPDDLGTTFNPNNLKIMHWRDNPNVTTDGSANEESSEDWEELETHIDTINNYAEASTENFSSFGLFVYDETAVEVEENADIPTTFEVFQNSPNPFNPVTLIRFTIPEAGYYEVSVYNIMGQVAARLYNATLTAGTHSMLFNGSSLASGVYFYRVTGAGFSATRKMLLLK